LCGSNKGVFQLARCTADEEVYTEVFQRGGKKIADVRRNIFFFRFAAIRAGVLCDIASNWLKEWRVGKPQCQS
jgi:hypothetical protein